MATFALTLIASSAAKEIAPKLLVAANCCTTTSAFGPCAVRVTFPSTLLMPEPPAATVISPRTSSVEPAVRLYDAGSAIVVVGDGIRQPYHRHTLGVTELNIGSRQRAGVLGVQFENIGFQRIAAADPHCRSGHQSAQGGVDIELDVAVVLNRTTGLNDNGRC